MSANSRIRFGVAVDIVASGDDLRSLAERAEATGFDVLLVPDHTFTMSPEVALMAAAAVTSTLRIGTLVYNNDLRHPIITAQQAATLDLLSGGRFELGLGAGWNEPEYTAMGWEMDRASIRIDRLEESAQIMRQLLSGQETSHAGRHYSIHGHTLAPTPPQGANMPIHIGGNGSLVLAVAARNADIVGISPYGMVDRKPFPTHFSADAIRERVDHVKASAGDRWDSVEINVPVQRVRITDDRESALLELAQSLARSFEDNTPGVDELADSPFVLVGTPEEIEAHIHEMHSRLDIGFFSMWAPTLEDMAPVVESMTA